MNVMINDISHDLHTDVKGVQTTITLFLLIMAVLMIPCSKLKRRHLDAAVDAFRHKTGADWLPTR